MRARASGSWKRFIRSRDLVKGSASAPLACFVCSVWLIRPGSPPRPRGRAAGAPGRRPLSKRGDGGAPGSRPAARRRPRRLLGGHLALELFRGEPHDVLVLVGIDGVYRRVELLERDA